MDSEYIRHLRELVGVGMIKIKCEFCTQHEHLLQFLNGFPVSPFGQKQIGLPRSNSHKAPTVRRFLLEIWCAVVSKLKTNLRMDLDRTGSSEDDIHFYHFQNIRVDIYT